MLVRKRFVHSLYCDDVRNEIGGKTTIVGIYGNELNVSAPENGDVVTLAKLCVAVTVQTPKEQPFLTLRLKLFKDDEVIQQIEVPSKDLVEAAATTEENEQKNFHTFTALFVAQPFPIASSFLLRVHAETESEEIMASALKVNLLSVEAAQTLQ